MKNIRLHIAYQGTDFHGWQKQPHCETVEGEIRNAAHQLLNGGDFEFQGASRTDAGVHAIGQVANLKHTSDRSVWDFVRALNAMTPRSIRINHAEAISENFNARHHSDGKRYRYHIFQHRFPNPLQGHMQWEVKGRLNTEDMKKAAALLRGEHDYSAFRASDCQSKSTIRRVNTIDVLPYESHIEIVVVGNAFLKNMVRIFAGTLVEVGLGQRDVNSVHDALKSLDRQNAGRTAPARGLVLEEVFYPTYPWGITPTVFLKTRYEK